jgi:hypothetical protein
MSNEPLKRDENESLKQENAELREKLARASLEAEMYRLTAKAWLVDTMPCEPLTDAEVNEMFHGPYGRPPLEMLEEFERTLPQDGE